MTRGRHATDSESVQPPVALTAAVTEDRLQPTIPRLPFLLEVGSEEIPARFIPPALAELRDRTLALLAQEQVEHAEVVVLGTPRRLALLCHGMAVRQPDLSVTVKGPSIGVAFDEAGQPTPAAHGFARKNGVGLAACTTIKDERGEYLAVHKVEPGRPTAEILAVHLPGIVLDLSFPKLMRWGKADLEYARPLQWLVALLGSEVVPLALGRVGKHGDGIQRKGAKAQRRRVAEPPNFRAGARSRSLRRSATRPRWSGRGRW